MASKKNIAWFEEILAEADAAGKAAVEKLNVVPMVVSSHVNQLDDNSPVVKQWYVPDGVCGFAWVNVKPGNSPFANFIKAKGIGRADSYEGGVRISISDYNQSLQKKEAHAIAFAEVLQAHGIKASGMSRID